MLKGIVSIIVVLALTSMPTLAENELWSADVAIANKSLEQRNLAIKTALQRVLTRVIAPDQEQYQQDQVIATLLDEAASYVNQYHYTSVENVDDNDPISYQFHVSFDEKALSDKLGNSQLPVWLGDRPIILIWLVLENKGTKQILDAFSQSEIALLLDIAAKKVGLPIIRPLMDLQDLQNISFTDVVLADNTESLKNASIRYDVDIFLVGKLRKQGDCWHSQWDLHSHKMLQHWSQECDSIDRVLEISLQDVYNQFFRYYADNQIQTDIDEMALKITGIRALNDLNRISSFLGSVAMIKSVSLNRIEQGRHHYHLKFFGTRERLIKKLTAGDLLIIIDKIEGESGEVWLALQP